jgi:hypothetical protein
MNLPARANLPHLRRAPCKKLFLFNFMQVRTHACMATPHVVAEVFPCFLACPAYRSAGPSYFRASFCPLHHPLLLRIMFRKSAERSHTQGALLHFCDLSLLSSLLVVADEIDGALVKASSSTL